VAMHCLMFPLPTRSCKGKFPEKHIEFFSFPFLNFTVNKNIKKNTENKAFFD